MNKKILLLLLLPLCMIIITGCSNNETQKKEDNELIVDPLKNVLKNINLEYVEHNIYDYSSDMFGKATIKGVVKYKSNNGNESAIDYSCGCQNYSTVTPATNRRRECKCELIGDL